MLHRVCHDKIHSIFTDKELARDYNTVEKLMQDERMIKFGKWVHKKVANFTDPSIMTNTKNRNKRNRWCQLHKKHVTIQDVKTYKL